MKCGIYYQRSIVTLFINSILCEKKLHCIKYTKLKGAFPLWNDNGVEVNLCDRG